MATGTRVTSRGARLLLLAEHRAEGPGSKSGAGFDSAVPFVTAPANGERADVERTIITPCDLRTEARGPLRAL